MLPIIFWSGPVPTCFSTSRRTVSRSRPIFCKTFTATPCPSLIRPSNRCSVPRKLWFRRSASLRASASTCCARGVKLLMASSLILELFCYESVGLSNANRKKSCARTQNLKWWPGSGWQIRASRSIWQKMMRRFLLHWTDLKYPFSFMKFLSAILLLTLLSLPASAQVRITEFMASNTSTLTDEDGDASDWIEIQNTSSNSVSLLNWALTDSAGNPGKWRFPATNISPKSFMIVFASGKDRVTPGAPLHTNFKLSADGEYLAMFGPDGTVASEISPQFPAQFPDVSYGIGMQLTATTPVATNAAIHFLIPANSSVDAAWTQTNFNDASWQTGTNGIGYETGIADPQEESFAAKVLATQPQTYWRLNETNGVMAVNLGSGGVSDGGGYMGGIVLGGAGPRPPQYPTFEPKNAAPTFDGTGAYVNGPFELVNNLP